MGLRTRKKSHNGRKTAKLEGASPVTNKNVKNDAPNHVLSYLERYIKQNGIGVNDLLPPEEFFVNETGMSRTSVREALGKLKALGIVESRRKRGMQLTRSASLIDLVRLFADDTIPPELISHLGAFRSALELGLQSEIFRRATEEDIAALRQLSDRMQASVFPSSEWTELDLEFHILLIQITGNAIAIWFTQLFRPFFSYTQTHMAYVSSRTKARHRLLVDALEQRDPLGFHLAMREHHARKVGFEDYDAHGQVIPEEELSR